MEEKPKTQYLIGPGAKKILYNAIHKGYHEQAIGNSY